MQIFTLNHIKAAFEAEIHKDLLKAYRLPIKNTQTRVIIGLSGGADSSVLALFASCYLSPHYPNMELIFTDTGAEPDSCYETLAQIEKLTGIPITRLGKATLQDMIVNQFNGFLPSPRARWCTRELKIAPLLEYMAKTRTQHGDINLAGIRADEANREGIQFQFSMEQQDLQASSAFPFVDLGITKEMVFRILDKTIGVPRTYQYRSRSGCSSCFFQRNQEYVGMLGYNPRDFDAAERLEKLSESDQQRWQLPSTSGMSLHYPVPAFVDLRKQDLAMPEPRMKKAKNALPSLQNELFTLDEEENEKQTLYCAIALYVDTRLMMFGGAEFTPGVYWQEFITISPSLSGLKNALKHYYQFKRTTPMPHLDVRDLKIAIMRLDFAPGSLDLGPPDSQSYTWKSGIALKQLRYLVRRSQEVLTLAARTRELEDATHIEASAQDEDARLFASETRAALERGLISERAAVGVLAWEGLYEPKDTPSGPLQLDLLGVSSHSLLKHDDVPMACLACSL